MVEHSHFARELNATLKETSLSAEDIILELKRRGFPLPSYTFSNWLQGYFLPRSDGAFRLVSVLETICGLSDNRLSNALLLDLSSGASFVPGDFEQEEVVGTPPGNTGFSVGDNRPIDWEANLIQKAVRDEVWVNADRTSVRHTATVLARVPAVPDPTFIFQALCEPHETMKEENNFYDVSGMTLKKQEIFKEENGLVALVTQFSLPDGVIPGDLHKLSYSWDEELDTPLEKINERFFPWTLDFYSCTVTFEAGIPEGIRYVTHKPIDGQRVEVPFNLPLVRDRHSVRMSMKGLGDLIGAFYCSAPA